MNPKLINILKTGFALYILLMLWLLFGQRVGLDYSGSYSEIVTSNLNLVPFQTIHNYLLLLSSTSSGTAFRHAIINLAGNVIMFVPLGFFLPNVFTKRNTFTGCLLQCAILILIIEIIQLFTLLGSCDIDDFILNMAGAAAGYGIYTVLRKTII